MRWPALLARARGSVRFRVTVLAAGAFAVTLIVASFVLLRALEGALVDDVRAEDLATLEAQAARVRAEGLPADVLERTTVAAGEAFTLPYPGTQRVVVYEPSIDDLAAEGTFVEEVTRQGGVPSASAALLGIQGFTVSTLAVGGGVLATASPLNDVRDTLDTTRQLLWIIGPVLVGLVAALAWVLAGRALRPVHAVTSRVAAITSRSLHDRVPEPSSTDEIADDERHARPPRDGDDDEPPPRV